MAHVRLIHWNGPEGRERTLRLASLGHHADFDDADGPGLLRTLRASVPDAFIIDLSRRPSQGREVALWLRSRKSTRHVPLLFVDGEPEKVARVKHVLPDATYTSWSRLRTALAKALARPVSDPVVPPSSIYSGKPVAQKLGIKGDMRVAVLNAPPGVMAILRGAPENAPTPSETVIASAGGATYTARPTPDCDVFLAFVRAQHELTLLFARLRPIVSRQTVWMAWPKQTSGIQTDVNGNVVRETGLAAGWVDFKVCAIDETWSGLAFKRRP